MSIQYQRELLKTDKIRLFANFSNLNNDTADENLVLRFYAVDTGGIPIFTEKLHLDSIRGLYNHLNSISVIRDGANRSSKFIETSDKINLILDKLEKSDLETILQLLEKFESEEKIKGLLESLSDLEIENLHGAFQHKLITQEIENLEKLIALEINGNILSKINDYDELLKYKAGQPEKIFSELDRRKPLDIWN